MKRDRRLLEQARNEMKLKGLSVKELEKLEIRLEKDITNAKETIAVEQTILKKLRNECARVKAKRRRLEYIHRLRTEFSTLPAS